MIESYTSPEIWLGGNSVIKLNVTLSYRPTGGGRGVSRL
jgi:hypothetical protein